MGGVETPLIFFQRKEHKMADFIEVTVNGRKQLINLNFVECVWVDSDGTTTLGFFDQERCSIEESYEEIRQLLQDEKRAEALMPMLRLTKGRGGGDE